MQWLMASGLKFAKEQIWEVSISVQCNPTEVNIRNELKKD